jgi:2-polyprenyl-3-methyl-5-hydroxy-6-metoxy-1,4-benzoquinol methylase
MAPLVLEPSGEERGRAVRRGLEVTQGTIEEERHWSERFDVILLCQTVDHLVDIAGTLRLIRHLLQETGLLFLDIVNGGEAKLDHPYRLREKTMSDFLVRTGFKTLEWGYAPDGRHINFVCGRA